MNIWRNSCLVKKTELIKEILACQICEARAVEMYGVDVSEAHHIQPFSLTANNDAKNMMIVCPDHHRIIHKAKPVFNYDQKAFLYDNGREDRLMYNIHL